MHVFRLMQWQEMSEHVYSTGFQKIHTIEFSDVEYQWEKARELAEKEFRMWCLIHSIDFSKCNIASDIKLY